jgi:XTP/dITP diphosphohydrolase
VRAPVRLLLASSNAGKLREFRAMAAGQPVELELLPRLADLPYFPEDAPTFAENAAGKALHYSRSSDEIVFADDSGLSVASLGGAPGVHSARYAGPQAGDAKRIEKLLGELRGKQGDARRARFVCVIAAAWRGNLLSVFSDFAEGEITTERRGSSGFGYDPVFFFPLHAKTFAEVTEAEKNDVSHRGKAFRKLIEDLVASAR